MQSLYGLTGIKMETLTLCGVDTDEINKFLKEHDGDIIDIQSVPLENNKCRVIIIYRGVSYV